MPKIKKFKIQRQEIVTTPKSYEELQDYIDNLPAGETRSMAHIVMFMTHNLLASRINKWQEENSETFE